MNSTITFNELNLAPFLYQPLESLGYEVPTPIQQASIPILLNGEDLLAQAQTGTGKTAAFALPILSQIDTTTNTTQAIIVTPTRELAIQVAEAFQRYAQKMKDFHVTAIYGGVDFTSQLKLLKRGVHVIVATPGRLIDHMKRGKISTDNIKTLILDEADEMLKMGFIDDVEWIIDQIDNPHQTALFSATMPKSIKTIAKKHLKDPQEIYIKPKENSIDLIEQSFIRIQSHQKMDLLTRILEVEPINGAIIFARTKTSSLEIAEKLQARGYQATALNGDMNQALREKTIQRMRDGSLDIIVATDVAARGIDIERISHVINYDIPYDTESYTHRIGRTGRAGRSGKALLFVTPREFHLLRIIERVTKKPIKKISPPSVSDIKSSRNRRLVESVSQLLSDDKILNQYDKVAQLIQTETGCDMKELACALLYKLNGPIDEITEIKCDDNRDKKKKRDRSRFDRSNNKQANKKTSYKTKRNPDKKYTRSKK
ncbi:DEAD/DEAH box helicase [Thiotrichales bacterium 19S11-10]|nr:DEAD/DEAH box helicase [Thiotrichales bacterium 19S11-10]